MTPSSLGRRVRAAGGALLATALAIPVVSVGVVVAATQSAPSPSLRDGVFNRAQVERGRAAYNALCARCHGETLGGGETSPALVDDRFFQVWAGRSVGQLVEYTRTTMPSDGPGRISRKRCVDIAAYVLSANGFPAGDTDLPTELDALDRLTITRTP